MAKVIIDGEEIEVAPGTMLIEAADALGKYIPRFCYHKKLSTAANCRMCMVEVENAPKPVPSCATPVVDGMKVWTKSDKIQECQRDVMEFLLINHPLDCPVCDQGGECELQDLAVKYSKGGSRCQEQKRVVVNKDLGPLIATEMTRCIHCTRCVRFGEEIAGVVELGAIGRGEHTEIGTFIERNVDSELSGNVIDLCPVGALTSKPFRFQARSWELTQTVGVAAHDCLGSNIYYHTQRGKVMRVVPKVNEELNENWLADRDRFSYQAINSETRLAMPLIKENGKWQQVAWPEALLYVNSKLQKIINHAGADQIGGLLSPSLTLEEYFIFQKYLRGLGSNNIDHRLRKLDFRDQTMAPLLPNLGVNFAELEQQDLVLLVGSDIQQQQPLASLKLRKLVNNGGEVCTINPLDFQSNFKVSLKQIPAQANLVLPLAGIAKVLLDKVEESSSAEIPAGAHTLLQDIVPTEKDQLMAEKIAAQVEGKSLILLGEFALANPKLIEIFSLAVLISKLTKTKFGVLTPGANLAGAWLTGCVPHRLPGGQQINEVGKTALEMLQTPLAAYLLFGIEPEFDSILGIEAKQTIAQAEFVVAFSAFQSESLKDVASVILPITLPAEMNGTLINVEGRWQSFAKSAKVATEAIPAWKTLQKLAILADLQGFNYKTTAELTAEVKKLLGNKHPLAAWNLQCPKELTLDLTVDSVSEHNSSASNLIWFGGTPPYHIDYVVRNAKALQQTNAAQVAEVQVNPGLAKNLKMSEGQVVKVKTNYGEAELPVKFNSKLPSKTVYIATSMLETVNLGKPYASCELTIVPAIIGDKG